MQDCLYTRSLRSLTYPHTVCRYGTSAHAGALQREADAAANPKQAMIVSLSLESALGRKYSGAISGVGSALQRVKPCINTTPGG